MTLTISLSVETVTIALSIYRPHGKCLSKSQAMVKSDDHGPFCNDHATKITQVQKASRLQYVSVQFSSDRCLISIFIDAGYETLYTLFQPLFVNMASEGSGKVGLPMYRGRP